MLIDNYYNTKVGIIHSYLNNSPLIHQLTAF